MRHALLALATAAVVLLAGAPRRVSAAVIAIDRIAGSGDLVPSGPGIFNTFYNPATDGTSVVFWGNSGPSEGIYRGAPGGALSAVVHSGSPVPEAPVNSFDRIRQETSIDEAGMVGFAATSTGQAGIRNGVYTGAAANGALQRVVDTTSPRPEGGTFGAYTAAGQFDRPSISNGRTSFVATGPAGPFPGSGERSIYTNATGTLAPVVTETNPGNTFGRPAASGQRVLYRHTTPTSTQQRLWENGVTTTAFNGGDSVPGLGQVFIDSDPSLDGTDFAFNGAAGGHDAVIARINGSFVKVADTTTPLPEGGGNFGGFLYEPSIDNGRVAFVAIGLRFPPLKHGVYLYDGGSIQKVVNVDDLLDGKTPGDFIIGPEALSGNLLTFRVVFTDQSQGIYVATVPEPGAVALFAASACLMLARRRQG